MDEENIDLVTELKTTLSKNKRFITENGELIKASITSASMQLNPEFINLLLSNEMIKNVFFTEIDSVLVFDKVKFNWVVSNKQFLPDSYTRYKNKIGLSTNDYNLITENNDVSLVFPYKDSILEGGQTSEEEQKDEVFYNEILAFDQVRNLLSPKSLTNAKKYTSNEVEEITNIDKTDNLIIKGNNLLALSSLLENYRGKIKLIYIDPPYNTGSDSFHYNDKFNHSTWLTFMKNRLEIAKELLRDDGLIFVQCDDKESAYLKVLMDNIFGTENFINNISVKMSEPSGNKMAHVDKRLLKIKETILLYKKEVQPTFNPIKIPKTDWDSEYNKVFVELTTDDKAYIDDISNKQGTGEGITEADLDNIDEIFKNITVSSTEKEYQNENSKLSYDEWLKSNSYRIFRTAASSSVKKLTDEKKIHTGQTYFFVLSRRDKLLYLAKSDYSNTSSSPRVQILFAEDYQTTYLGDMWTDISTTGLEAEGSVQLKNGKKPEKLLKRIIEFSTNEGDIVLDFFMGSGTTQAVAHKINRQYIGIEQMDYINSITVPRLQKVIKGEQNGISKSVNWQGGGNFVYVELKELNEKYVKIVSEATELKELKSIYKDLKDKGLLIPSLETRELEKEEEFNILSFEQQKEVILLAIDKNKLYVNASQIDDKEMGISDYEKELTLNFYGKESSDDTRQGTLSI